MFQKNLNVYVMNPIMKKNVTIRDVAGEADVSVCTVSWVLCNHPRCREVGEKTRKRILETAAKLGYRRNMLASATRTGLITTIAVLLDPVQYRTTIHFNWIVNGILLEASFRKYSVKLFSEKKLDDSFRQIVENRIDKVIMIGVDPQLREQAALLAEQYSINLIYAFERGHRCFSSVNVDNAETTSSMVRYLAEHGHSRIAMLCVPHRYHYVEERHEGYLRGMKECGLKVDPCWIRCSDDITGSVDSMLALPLRQRPTAFVTPADQVAALAMRHAQRRGLRIPEDFSIIGIGNTELAQYTPVDLTTMDESLMESGKLLARLILGEKPGYPPDEYNVYHTHSKIVERESVYTLKASRRSGKANNIQES